MIGQRLIARDVISAADLERALAHQRSAGGLLGETLVALRLATEADVAKALAAEARVPFRTINGMAPDPAAVALVPEALARRHTLAPVALDDGGLRVVQANPFDVLAIDELERSTGRRVVSECAARHEVTRLIERCYAARSAVQDLVQQGVTAFGRLGGDVRTGEAPVVRLIELLLNDAIAHGATDLHIEPEDRIVRIRHRIDGMLIPGETIPKVLHPALISRLKVMAGLDITEQRLPQEGRITEVVGNRRIDVRVSTFPTTAGEKVALRILEKDKLIRGIEELGFDAVQLAAFRDLLARSRGMVLVTGPTGAGKTTTLYSALNEMATRNKNILTVEDPVEYQLPSIRQTQIRPKAGLTFPVALRSLLRQDPDVIMIGEIRDPETAQLALRAALSGILVFSTLHTSDSAGVPPRLMDMGLEPYLLASSIAGVVAQRLVRMICHECREPVTYPADVLAKAGITGAPPVFYRGRGCSLCRETGYRGRTGVFEILLVGDGINSMIRERADSRRIKAVAVQHGLRPILADALGKAAAGETTLEEVLRVAYE